MIDLWARRPLLVGCALGVLSSLLVWWASDDHSVIRSGDPLGFYTALASVAAALAAIGLVPISIVLGLSSPRVRRLTKSRSSRLRRTVEISVFWYLSCIFASVALLAIDSAEDPVEWGRILVFGLLVPGIEATMRNVVEFLAILRTDAETADVIGNQPKLGADWVSTLLPDGEKKAGS